MKVYEDYFVQAWRDNPALNAELPGDFTLTGLDYAKTKLFMLSILWRASVSVLPDFSAVKLGPHEERIRKMLLASDAGCPEDYRVIAGLIWDPVTKRRWDNILMPPLYLRVNGGAAYRMVLGGASWTVIVSKHTNLSFDPRWLTIDGQLHLTCCSWSRFSGLSGATEALSRLPDDDPRP